MTGTIAELIATVRGAGVTLTVDRGDLVLRPAGVIPDEIKRELKARKRQVMAELTHADLAELSDEFRRWGRIRIEVAGEGDAWLVESYDQADDIQTGGVYSVDMLPTFVALTSEQKVEVHQFLSALGGGRFDGALPTTDDGAISGNGLEPNWGAE